MHLLSCLFPKSAGFAFESSSTGLPSGLLNVRQGNRSVANYSIDFRTRARRLSYNLCAQIEVNLHGLADFMNDGWNPKHCYKAS